jgi:hypothetical protein
MGSSVLADLKEKQAGLQRPETAARRGSASAWRKKKPRQKPGRESLIAVITLRLLLREEKQGTTALRLSFTGKFSALER